MDEEKKKERVSYDVSRALSPQLPVKLDDVKAKRKREYTVKDRTRPYFDAVYEAQRKRINANDDKESPDNRLAFSQYKVAELIQEEAKKAGDEEYVNEFTLGEIDVAVEALLKESGLSRAERKKAAMDATKLEMKKAEAMREPPESKAAE
jgi:G:T/U-mismatch repair DNA glycosylase